MEIELYEGAIFVIPKPPPKEKILNYGLPKKDQRWVRTELPADWDTMLEANQEEFAFEEDRKCTEGIHFYNNGVLTYITGDHYYYLNWFTVDIGYPQYRDRDRRWFYHWWICDNDIQCIGQCYSKHRRDGYSYRVSAIILNRARKTFKSNYGIISKTGLDAQEMFSKVTFAFKYSPEFFKPQVRTAEDTLKELIFQTPQQKVTYKNRRVKKEISLETRIDYRNTKQNAYDGSKQKILACDEVAKWEEVDFEKWYNIGKTCVTLGGKIIGKLLVGSTVNEATKGGKEYRSIWNRSSMLKKNDNGRTGSWLYRYFVPAYDGLEGFIDEYGASVIETPKEPVLGIDGFWITMGSKEYLLNERRSLEENGDTVGYFEELRQRPFTEDEMFRDPGNENTQFDLNKIYAQKSFNDSIPNPVLVRGNFAWENGKKDTKVIWEVTPQGRWLVYWMPLPEDRNKIILKRGQKAPGNPHEGLFSVDPYDHKYTTSKKKSKAASHGMHKTSFSNPALSGIPISQYWYRPNDPSILYEDMLMQCIFYGWPILGESNKPGCINHFRNRGYEHFLMDRPAFTHTEYSEKNQKEKWLPNTGDADKGIRRMLIEHAASKVYRSVGVNDETQRMGNFMFNDTLTDLSKFDPDNWTDYDLTVSYMLGVIGLDDYVPQKKERPKNPKFFQTYSHEGMISEPVNAFPKDFKGGGPIIVNPDSETAKKTSEARRRWGL